MTTPTPEKEAELRDKIVRQLAATASGAASDRVELKWAEARDLLSLISTERQAREALEEALEGVEQQLKDANVAVQTAEKEAAEMAAPIQHDHLLRLKAERDAAEQEATRQLNCAVEWFDKFKAAEKEVERLKLSYELTKQREMEMSCAGIALQAKLAALAEAVRRSKAQFEFYVEQHMAKTPPDIAKAEANEHFASICREALSALPPPVPAQEGEPQRCSLCAGTGYMDHAGFAMDVCISAGHLHPATAAMVDSFALALKGKLRAAEVKHGHGDGWRSDDWSDKCRADLLAHVHKGDPLDVAAYAAFCWAHGWSTTPTQAPQDVAGLVEEAEFLVARLNDFALTGFDDDPVREFQGHVAPSAARLKSTIAALRPSPISHETKALELAAADNNREALVEALTKIARDGENGMDMWGCRFAARDALAALQSRQEGKQP